MGRAAVEHLWRRVPLRLRRTLLISHIDSDLKGAGGWYEDESEDEDMKLSPFTKQSEQPIVQREAGIFWEKFGRDRELEVRCKKNSTTPTVAVDEQCWTGDPQKCLLNVCFLVVEIC